MSIVYLMLGVGLAGTLMALFELKKYYSPKTRYWLNFNRHQAFPSFSGLGSVFMIGITRISRDRQFTIALGLIVLMTLTGRLNWYTKEYWLDILLVGLLILLIVTVDKLSTIGTQLLEQFPSLPISRGVINLAVGVSGLTIITVISSTIFLALTELGLMDIIRLCAIILICNLVAYLMSLAWYAATHSDPLGSWRLVTTQTIVLILLYLGLIQLPLNFILIAVAGCMIVIITIVSCLESSYWATIGHNG